MSSGARLSKTKKTERLLTTSTKKTCDSRLRETRSKPCLTRRSKSLRKRSRIKISTKLKSKLSRTKEIGLRTRHEHSLGRGTRTEMHTSKNARIRYACPLRSMSFKIGSTR